jgi:hypothetical protein
MLAFRRWEGGLFRQQNDVLTLTLFFENEKSRLKIEMGGAEDTATHRQHGDLLLLFA